MHILFIGNSHTHVNDVPGSVQRLLRWATQELVECSGCTTDSVGLEWHWQRKETHARLQERSFDFVVLQERSGGPTEVPESTRKHALLWSEEVQRRGAIPVVYGTWTLANDLAAQPRISELYTDIASAAGARLARVGDAWAAAGRQRADVRLYDDDGRHAAPAGSFLAAAVIARTIGAFPNWPGDKVPAPSNVFADQARWLVELAQHMCTPVAVPS